MTLDAESYPPPIAKRQLVWFLRYVDWYLRRNFHGFRLLQRPNLDSLKGWPVLVCCNHPSWWDPLLCLHLSERFFRDRSNYGPIAAEGISKYKFMERLGFFSIDRSSRAGAEKFLRVGAGILKLPDGVLWITPQGEFVDIRSRPIVFEHGAGHLTRRVSRLAMLPLALEYSFWNERYPEAFAAFGEPVFIEDGSVRSPKEWSSSFAGALEVTQNALAAAVQRRDPHPFESLLAGRAGIGGV